MLTLSRSVNEAIYIGQDVVLTVRKVQRGRVQIAIDAPRDVSIVRGELLRKDAIEASRSIGRHGARNLRRPEPAEV